MQIFFLYYMYNLYPRPPRHAYHNLPPFYLFMAFLTPLLSDSLALVSGDFNVFSTRPLSLLGLDNIVQFPTRDQAYFDYAYVNHPWLFSTQK